MRLSRPYAGRPACIGNNVCNPNCPIGAKHSGVHDLDAARAAGARFRANAVVDRLERDGAGRIASVSYLDPAGARTTLTARIVVIAAHGFETPKLLLTSDLANSSGMVGRNLMMHPTLALGLYADEPLWGRPGPVPPRRDAAAPAAARPGHGVGRLLPVHEPQRRAVGGDGAP